MKQFKSMKSFIDHMNQFIEFSNKKPVNYPVRTNRDAFEVFEELDNHLSPENLHCDGEISLHEANKKYFMLERLGKMLIRKGFKPPKYSHFENLILIKGKIFNTGSRRFV